MLTDSKYTALHYATRHGYTEIVRILLARPDLDLQTNVKNRVGTWKKSSLSENWKETPLHIAAKHNQQEIVNLLLAHNVPYLNAQDLYNVTKTVFFYSSLFV